MTERVTCRIVGRGALARLADILIDQVNAVVLFRPVAKCNHAAVLLNQTG
jgi:hypothetical protein